MAISESVLGSYLIFITMIDTIYLIVTDSTDQHGEIRVKHSIKNTICKTDVPVLDHFKVHNVERANVIHLGSSIIIVPRDVLKMS